MLVYFSVKRDGQRNAGLQLRRAISIQAEGKKLLEKHAVAPSAARLCSTARLSWSLLQTGAMKMDKVFDFSSATNVIPIFPTIAEPDSN